MNLLMLLSPAKTLDYESPVPAPVRRRASEPVFIHRAAELIALLRPMKPARIAELMDLSEALAALNVSRYAAWQPNGTEDNSKPAVLAFNGDVYEGLDAASLAVKDLEWAQAHLVILSGLYGALRPLDRLQPYRLEMGTALKNASGKDLYAFWGDTLAQYLNDRAAEAKVDLIVNLASQEYAKAVVRRALRPRLIECVFEDWKGGSYKVVSFFAKRARGLMARHAILSRARSIGALQAFDGEGYAFAASASDEQRLVFRRRIEG